MKNKERYEWGYYGKYLKHYILDTKTKEELGYEEIFDLLNQQDNRINLLLKENQLLKEELKLAKLSEKMGKRAKIEIANSP